MPTITYVFDHDAMRELIWVQYDFDVALAHRDWKAVEAAQARLGGLYNKLRDAGMTTLAQPVRISDVLMGAQS